MSLQHLDVWFSESVDVKDRGHCGSPIEAGLSATAAQEHLTVAGVFTDLTRLKAIFTVDVHFTVSCCLNVTVLALASFCKFIVCLSGQLL